MESWSDFVLGYMLGRSSKEARALKISNETLRRLERLRKKLGLSSYEEVILFLLDYYEGASR